MICFLGGADWANISNRIARAINERVGEMRLARVATLHAHPYGYPEDIVVDRDGEEELAGLADQAEWLVTTGDGDYRLLEKYRRPHHRIAVTHAGTAYRQDPARFAAEDDKVGAVLRFVGCDSIRLMSGDPRARPYFGTCDLAPEAPGPIAGLPIVTHSPSVRAKKGTDAILPVLEKLAAEGLCEILLIEGVGPEEAQRLRAGAHVHVDQMNPAVGGFGQSAIEAMGLGCAVLADVRHVLPHKAAIAPHLKPPPVFHVGTAKRLERCLRVLLRDGEYLAAARRASWTWSERWSSPDAVAGYWLRQLGVEPSSDD